MNSSVAHIYTMSEFLAYGHRLHYNTAIDVVVNGIATYIVLWHSTKAMAIYKYFLLFTIFCAFLLDFHLTFFFGPFVMLPSTIMCGAGLIAKNFDWIGGQIIPFDIMHIYVTAVGFSIIYGFLYQYYSITSSADFLCRPSTVILFIILIICYPMPSIFLIHFFIDYERSAAHVKQHFPNSHDLYIKAPCYTVVMDHGGRLYYSFLLFQIILPVAFAFFVAYNIHKRLMGMKNVLSKATLKARTQLLRALLLQLTVPSLFMVFPVIILLCSVLTDFSQASLLSNAIIPLMAFHSPTNALTVLVFITPYRQTLLRWIRKALFIKPESSVLVFPGSDLLSTRLSA